MKIRLSLWFSETKDAFHSPGNFIFILFIIGFSDQSYARLITFQPKSCGFFRGILNKFGRFKCTFFILFITRLVVTKKAVLPEKNVLKQR